MNIELEIETPRMPNFLRIKMPAVQRQDGFKGAPMIAIGDLSDENIGLLAEQIKIELLAIAKRQREQK